jgi:F-type H+-transporting ATPase subunit a
LYLGSYAQPLPGESDESHAQRQLHGQTLRNDWEVRKANLERIDREQYLKYEQEHPWSAAKIESYNRQLDGKIIIPQPFGRLRNNYEAESGFCISKFMILELVVAALLIVAFKRLANYVKDGRPASGKLWNMFEAFLLYIRDQIARPAIGKHDADRFVPLLWTMFMFVLFCNLFGMLPWVGAPTGSFSVTLGLALVTFATVLVAGSLRFGVVGFWKNQVPSMGLPLPLAIPIVPMIFVIEVLGLMIKHAVLGIRLLANMVAGHLVLLAIMGLAVAAAVHSAGELGASYWITAVIAVGGSALFSLLELFVAFLQAYVFTFLSALFIGAAVHHH